MDLESLWLGRLDDLDADAEVMRAADLSNRATWDALHNEKSLTLLLDGFQAERERLVERVVDMDAGARARTALHPRLMQPMSVADLCFFVAEHDDHHLAAITELLEG